MPLTNMTAGMGAPNTAVMGGGDPNSWASILGGLANTGANIYGTVQAGQLQGDANTVLQQSNPFGQYRPGYGAQLQTLMSDPSSVAQLPGYQFLMDQGTQALQRSAAGPGGTGLGSGAMGADLVKYGQGLADQFYQQQVSTLSHLAGADISPANPAQALAGKGGAAGSLGSSLTGLANSLPGGISGVTGLLSKLFGGGGGGGGTAGSGAPGTYDPNTSSFTGAPGQTSVDWSGQTTANDPWSTGTPTWNLPVATTGGGFTGAPGQTSVDWGQTGGGTDPTAGGDVPSFDLGGIFSNPNSAGGQAAPSASAGGTNTLAGNWGTVGQGIGYAGAGLGIAQGLASGKPTGEAGAVLSGVDLAAKGGAFGGNSGAVGGGAVQGLDVLSIYSGIKQGGVAGYAQAANAAYGLASGTAGIPGVGQALSVYNFAKNWGSGDTGGDALRGAEAGASIGTMVLPGIGTLVGGAIGGAVGAISSVFGNGKVDPENSNFNGFTQAYNAAKTPQAKAQVAASTADPYLPLAGLFDLRSNQIKGNIPIVDQYGRMGEQKFVTDMFSQINTSLKQGKITKSSSTDDIMSTVVAPWISSFGKGAANDSNTDAINAMVAGIVDDYRTGQQGKLKAVGGDAAFTNVPAFGS
jgi:hypothetical protein